ncbi:TetR/AcrR family transcriptional regulator C-terminal domain-containing protein [Streptomyces odonnellii]|uniref:TetR/AcrR family transcriptional regulator C-terminal domain-containing protein n=1 Tax=Streptomyces odonnellii TaxID=1417980 RepID=UPI000626A5EF|nr:TetR/AcrR family transcriptional regulator C-terminal domain-containing protein [Streptomyces odonnellii]
MSIIAGQGGAAVSMALLWAQPGEQGPRTAPGPKPALSVDAIVEAAIAVADADTMAGLSMRTVAERLGRSSMALYTYVPGKAELLDLMYDRVHAELSTGHNPGEGWQTAVETWAGDLRAFYLRHPWVLQVSYARPVLGPHEQAVLESLAAMLYETGLPARTLRAVVSCLFHFVRGSARTTAESRRAASATGVSDQDWWTARSTLLNEVAPDFADRFPLSVRLAKESAAPPEGEPAPSWDHQLDDAFTIGLKVLLDGVEATRTATASLP